MEKTAVQKLAGVLKILVTITFVCNLIVLLLVPGLVHMQGARALPELAMVAVSRGTIPFIFAGRRMVLDSWDLDGGYAVTFVLTLFLLFCGICTAVILWQGRRVLGTILTGAPFRAENGVSLRRAAVCCF
ncbi:MAG: hypothetical protein V8S11_01360 [Flavonifractor plautii]